MQNGKFAPITAGNEFEASAASSSDALKSEAPPLDRSGLAAASQFLREHWLRVVAISIGVLTPSFWHQRIEAGDLASHTYNAWLVQLIESGQAPGLWLARQSTNILFDVTLSGLANLVPLRAAEKIVVAVSVLLFFWGAFAFICAVTRRIPWFLLPALAMFTYGWTFQQGFLNYYISLSLALWGVCNCASRPRMGTRARSRAAPADLDGTSVGVGGFDWRRRLYGRCRKARTPPPDIALGGIRLIAGRCALLPHRSLHGPFYAAGA